MTTLWLQKGHGKGDPGAVYGNRTEAKEASKLVNEAVKIAKPHLAPKHKIKKMRNLNYVKAVKKFNRRAGSLDLYAEVHFNSHTSKATGTEVLYGHKPTADTMQTALVKELGLADRGTKKRDFYVTTRAVAGGEVSGVIVEMAFINNPDDMQVIDEKGAHALATALVSLTHGKYTPIKENDMFKGKSAEYWHNQMVKQKSYKETWRKRHGDVKSNLAECKKEKEGLKADIKATESGLGEARMERDELRERNDDLSGALKEANKRLADNNHTVDVGEDTRSWFEKIINLFRR